MKNQLLLGCFLFFTCLSYAQVSPITKIEIPRGTRVESTEIIDGVATHNYSSKSTIPINGSPFLNENFTAGVLELYDGSKSGEVLLRYNISKDLFEILRNEDTLTLVRPFAVKYIYFNDEVFIFDPKLREDTERIYNGYFQLRVDGKLSLYIKRRKELSFDSFAQNYKGGSGTKEYYYIDKVSYVGKTKKGKAFLLNSSKKLLKNLHDYKAEVKTFIKVNKIKFKKEEDIVKVIEYYNSL